MKTQSVWLRCLTIGALFASLLVATSVSAAPVRVGTGMFTTPGDNPVNLGLSEPTFRITFLPADLTLGSNSWTWSDINYYLDKHLTDEIKEELVAVIPEDGLELDWQSWSGVGLGVSSFSTNVSIRTVANSNLSKDLVDLVLRGNELNRDYGLDGSRVGAAAYGDVSVGIAFNLGPSVRLGGRYHRLMGIGYLEAEATGSGRVNHAPGDSSFEGNMRIDARRIWGGGLHGDGAAYDVGISIQPTANLALGLAVLDIGQITWRDVLSEQYEGSLDPDTGPTLELDRSEVISSLKWNLPTRYEVSMGYRLSESLHFGAAYTRTTHTTDEGFTVAASDEVRGMISWTGGGILPIGVGITYTPESAISISGEAGLRFGPVRTRLRLTDLQAALGSGDGKALGVTLDLGIVF